MAPGSSGLTWWKHSSGRGDDVVVLETSRPGVGRCLSRGGSASSSAYGNAEELPKHEAMVPCPLSPYTVSKLGGEAYCTAFHTSCGLSTVALRYFNVFGPAQDAAAARAGRPAVDQFGMARGARVDAGRTVTGVPRLAAGPDPQTLATNRGEEGVAKKPFHVADEPGRNSHCPCGSGEEEVLWKMRGGGLRHGLPSMLSRHGESSSVEHHVNGRAQLWRVVSCVRGDCRVRAV